MTIFDLIKEFFQSSFSNGGFIYYIIFFVLGYLLATLITSLYYRKIVKINKENKINENEAKIKTLKEDLKEAQIKSSKLDKKNNQLEKEKKALEEQLGDLQTSQSNNSEKDMNDDFFTYGSINEKPIVKSPYSKDQVFKT